MAWLDTNYGMAIYTYNKYGYLLLMAWLDTNYGMAIYTDNKYGYFLIIAWLNILGYCIHSVHEIGLARGSTRHDHHQPQAGHQNQPKHSC